MRFKGNIDLVRLEQLIEAEGAKNIPFCMITVTNNTGGGQPVSMENIRSAKELLAKHRIPLIIDACRFAENSYFIKEHEPGYSDRNLLEIAKEMFSLADGATMSAKKDGLANIGGFFGCNDDRWADDFRINLLILTEGFPTYGGLAGRDLEAIAVGLMEALDWEYQRYRHATVEYVATRLISRDIPIVRPPGGHAIFIDAAAFCPHLKSSDYPGIGLINALYLEGGIRAVELGSVMFGKPAAGGRGDGRASQIGAAGLPAPRLYAKPLRLCRRVLDLVHRQRDSIKPCRIIMQAPFLRHFTAHFAHNKNARFCP